MQEYGTLVRADVDIVGVCRITQRISEFDTERKDRDRKLTGSELEIGYDRRERTWHERSVYLVDSFCDLTGINGRMVSYGLHTFARKRKASTFEGWNGRPLM